jgi:hypothetical protein
MMPAQDLSPPGTARAAAALFADVSQIESKRSQTERGDAASVSFEMWF